MSAMPPSLPTPTALTLLGPPPLNPGDDAAAYDTLLARLVAEVGPSSLVEETCVREVAEMMWETARLRRLKAKLMTVSAPKGLHEVLRSIGVEFTQAHALAPRWAARELTAVGAVDALLNAAGLDIHHVMAKTLELRLDRIEPIDRMAAAASARRATYLRELLLYRDPAFVGRLQGAIATVDASTDAILDGEIARLPAPEAAAPAAAEGAAGGAP